MKSGDKRKREDLTMGVADNINLKPEQILRAFARDKCRESKRVRKWRDWICHMEMAHDFPKFIPSVIERNTFAERLLKYHVDQDNLGTLERYFGNKHIEGDVLTSILNETVHWKPSVRVFEWLCREKGMAVFLSSVEHIAAMNRPDLVKLLCEGDGIVVCRDNCMVSREEVATTAGTAAIREDAHLVWRWLWLHSRAFARPIQEARTLAVVRKFATQALTKGRPVVAHDVVPYLNCVETLHSERNEMLLKIAMCGDNKECLEIVRIHNSDGFRALSRNVIKKLGDAAIVTNRFEAYVWLRETYRERMTPPIASCVHVAIQKHGYTPLLAYVLDTWPLVATALCEYENFCALKMVDRIKFRVMIDQDIEGLCDLHKRGCIQVTRMDVARMQRMLVEVRSGDRFRAMTAAMGELIGMRDPSTWDLTKPLSEWQ